MGLKGDIERFGDRAFPTYDDESVPVADRVWSYLHSNCSSCHYRVGGRGALGRSQMPDVRFDLFAEDAQTHPLSERLCGVESTADDIGLGEGAPIISPGNPGDWADLEAGGSVLYLRMAARPSAEDTTGVMPPLGTAIADREGGLALVQEWISGLTCD